MTGHPADLIQLADGRVCARTVCANRITARLEESGLSFSRDEGETWDLDSAYTSARIY